MYRLTITQASNTEGYLVADAETLDQIQLMLEDYKKQDRSKLFTGYDIIQYNEILEDSVTLEDISFTELKKEGYV